MPSRTPALDFVGPLCGGALIPSRPCDAAPSVARSSVLSVDIDPDALAVARQNIASLEMEDEVELVHARIEPSPASAAAAAKPAPSYPDTDTIPIFNPQRDFPDRKFHTVVMNPPFGSWRSGIDMVFLELACQVRLQGVVVERGGRNCGGGGGGEGVVGGRGVEDG